MKTYNYGKIHESCSCGTTIYTDTAKGPRCFELGEPGIRSDGGILTSDHRLPYVEYPLPALARG